MKLKGDRRKKRQKRGQHEWKPQVSDLVLSRCQPVSEDGKGVTRKFMRPQEDLWRITKIIPPSVYEISTVNGRVRGMFHKQALKSYQKVHILSKLRNSIHMLYLGRVCCVEERGMGRERLLINCLTSYNAIFTEGSRYFNP
jgi:hypothetical protein